MAENAALAEAEDHILEHLPPELNKGMCFHLGGSLWCDYMWFRLLIMVLQVLLRPKIGRKHVENSGFGRHESCTICVPLSLVCVQGLSFSSSQGLLFSGLLVGSHSSCIGLIV